MRHTEREGERGGGLTDRETERLFPHTQSVKLWIYNMTSTPLHSSHHLLISWYSSPSLSLLHNTNHQHLSISIFIFLSIFLTLTPFPSTLGPTSSSSSSSPLFSEPRSTKPSKTSYLAPGICCAETLGEPRSVLNLTSFRVLHNIF